MPRKDARVLGEELVPLTGRFPLSVVTRIDARLDAMRRAMPGIPLGRSDVLRVLLVQALDALDAEADLPETRRVAGRDCSRPDRVADGSHLPPAPTERSVRISRTTLFRR
ncbi:MAG TPA: hypothetical protein VI542_00095 [Candidatus Tectomicrobia bacterium]